MRKRAVKNVFVELFWNVIYFLPVIMALFSLAFHTAFYTSTDEQADEQADKVTEEEITDLTGTTWTFNDSFSFVDKIDYGDKKVYTLDFSADGKIFVELVFSYDYWYAAGDTVVFCYDSNGSEYTIYDNYKDGIVEEMRTITIMSGTDVTTVELIDFLRFSADLVVDTTTSSETSKVSVYDVMKDGFTSSMKVVGYTPEADPVYGIFEQFFITDYFKVFQEGAWILEFACYYVYVHLLRILVDAVLFIPRFCQRCLEEGMRGES